MLCFFLPTCFLILRLQLSSTQKNFLSDQIMLFKILPEPAQAYGAQSKFNLEPCIVAKFHTVAGRSKDRVEHQHSLEEIYYVGNRQDFTDDFWLKHILSFVCCPHNKFVFVPVSSGVPFCSYLLMLWTTCEYCIYLFFLHIPHIPPAFWTSRTEHGVLRE